MEKISTSSKTLLPRTANLATLAVVVAATWWSGAQRPAGQAELAATNEAPAAHAVRAPAASHHPAALSGTTGATGTTSWPAQAATTLARDGMQTVGYQTRTR